VGHMPANFVATFMRRKILTMECTVPERRDLDERACLEEEKWSEHGEGGDAHPVAQCSVGKEEGREYHSHEIGRKFPPITPTVISRIAIDIAILRERSVATRASPSRVLPVATGCPIIRSPLSFLQVEFKTPTEAN